MISIRRYPAPTPAQFKAYIESDPDHSLIAKFNNYPADCLTTMYRVGRGGGEFVSVVEMSAYVSDEYDQHAVQTLEEIAYAYARTIVEIYEEVMDVSVRPATTSDLPKYAKNILAMPSPFEIHNYMVQSGYKRLHNVPAEGMQWSVWQITYNPPTKQNHFVITLPERVADWTPEIAIDVLQQLAQSEFAPITVSQMIRRIQTHVIKANKSSNL